MTVEIFWSIHVVVTLVGLVMYGYFNDTNDTRNDGLIGAIILWPLVLALVLVLAAIGLPIFGPVMLGEWLRKKSKLESK